MAVAFFNGTIYWHPPVVYKSACKIDIQYFPFDEQKCILKLGSWTYDSSKIDLISLSNRVEMELYWVNQEWNIVDTIVDKHYVHYPCCDDDYVDLTFAFVLHRKSLFYAVTMVLPCVFIAFLTIFVFYLPSRCCEKITLCISILLALVVFLLLIAESIPATSKSLPLIGTYLLFTMGMVSLSTVVTVIIINIFYRGDDVHTMPSWVKIIFIESNLPKYLWVERPADYLRYNVTCNQDQQRAKTIKAMSSASSGDFLPMKRSYSDSPVDCRSYYTRNTVSSNIYTAPPRLEHYNLALSHTMDEGMEWPRSGESFTALLNGNNVERDTNAGRRDGNELPEPLKQGLRCLTFIVERTKAADRDRKVI